MMGKEEMICMMDGRLWFVSVDRPMPRRSLSGIVAVAVRELQ